MPKWCIASVSMGGTLDAKLEAAAKAGFHAIEIFENDLTFFSGRVTDIRARASDLGLDIVALQPMRDFEGMPEPARARNFERAKRKFDLMDELGTSVLSICSNVSPEAAPDPARAAADLAELADLAAARGKRIGYEALAWGRRVKDWMSAYDLVRRADRPNLGVILDSFHICAGGDPLAQIADIDAHRIALVQVADGPGLAMDVLAKSRHHRCLPGQGDFPVDVFLSAALATGYEGPISVEIFNDQFRAMAPVDVARDAMRSLLFLYEKAAQRSAAEGRSPPADAALPQASITGIEFIEFTAGGADADRLALLLNGLGFTRVARHKSKQVDLYRQNAINIVMNREPEGFAHAFYLVHGAAVCALALRARDAAQSLRRANALLAPTYWGRVGPGEAHIPAIAGMGGSLLYIVPDDAADGAIWNRDFLFEGNGRAQGDLASVDHLSNVAPSSEFLSWLLFYKATLGFVDESPVELVDPHGAFFSRVVRSPGGETRIPLNVAEGEMTVASRFVARMAGGGYQHIALATDDLFAFSARARSRGVRFLPIPDNYYEDLASRFDLADAALERMKEYGILYDRIGSGELFQAYTIMYDERFFFEIVQRKGYDQFGAANTPARLAAQAALWDEESKTRVLFE